MKRYIVSLIAFVLVQPILGQEDDKAALVADVAKIAQLAVSNAADIETLKDRVSDLELGISSRRLELGTIVEKRLVQKEEQRTITTTATPWISTTPSPVIPITGTYQAPLSYIVRPTYQSSIPLPRTVNKTRTVSRSGGPVRRVFRGLFGRNLTTQVGSSGHWTFPGNSIAQHLMGSPHYLPWSQVYSMSHEEMLNMHDWLHER